MAGRIGEIVAGHGARLLGVEGPPIAEGAVRYAACIPVRNEAAHIGRCLAALNGEFARAAHSLVLINDSDDESAEIVTGKIARGECAATAVTVRWQEGLGSAPRARALAFELALSIAPNARLLSTDGDTLVCPGLLRAYDACFEAGFDLVCGRIGFLPEEAACLPPADPQRDAAIRAYRDASREIGALCFPDPDNPFPHHGNIGGANFAITSEAYRKAGPIPLVAFGEDRALRRRCEAHGLRISYADGPRVETSCRLDRPATGGLAAELLRNRTETDPLVDEALETPRHLLQRLRMRRLVEEGVRREAVTEALVAGRLTPERAGELACWSDRKMAWFHAEAELPSLARERLRFSEMARCLPSLLRLRDEIAKAPPGSFPSLAD
ncbi:MAG: glycosyltransferase [Pseudomonadota bacterium]|nr:glycosyltransferase [Pseudomonadota bacterium]